MPPLNAALPAGTPRAQPIGAFNGLAAGETVQLDQLSTGTHSAVLRANLTRLDAS